MGRPSHPEDLRSTVLGRIRAGHSFARVARDTGLSKGAIGGMWRAYGDGDLSHRKKPKASKTRHEKWMADYKRGLTTGQIAIRAGVSRASVVIALSKMSPTGSIKDLRRHHPQI